MAFVKNLVRAKDCGKMKFPSEEAAIRGGCGWRGGAGLTPYFHGPCRAWHVGHPPVRRKR